MVDQLRKRIWMLLRPVEKRPSCRLIKRRSSGMVGRFIQIRGAFQPLPWLDRAGILSRVSGSAKISRRSGAKTNPVGGHDNDRIKVLHIVYRTSDPESSYVMRIVSSSAKHGISYTEQIPLSEYRGGIYLRDDIPDEHLDEAA